MPTIHLLTEVPGPKSQAIVARRVAATPQGAAKLTNIAIAHAQGAALTDVDGNTFLDFAGGIGMLAVGHCPPELVAAIQAQAAAYINPCAIVLSHEPYVRVAELLNEVTPGTFPKKNCAA
jgi:4-aminobutyrate aminotransferase/(S)-3-amino-2-methylpropionate transaminase